MTSETPAWLTYEPRQREKNPIPVERRMMAAINTRERREAKKRMDEMVAGVAAINARYRA